MKSLYVLGNNYYSHSSDFHTSFAQLIDKCTILNKPTFPRDLGELGFEDVNNILNIGPTLIIIIIGDTFSQNESPITEAIQQLKRLYSRMVSIKRFNITTCGLITGSSADNQLRHHMFFEYFDKQTDYELADVLLRHLLEIFPEYTKSVNGK